MGWPQDISACCSDRIVAFSKWIGIATLRSLGVPNIPEELQAEPISCKYLACRIVADI